MSTIYNEKQVDRFHEEVDPETGEIYPVLDSSEIITNRFYKSSDEFIQIYLEDMSGILNITSKSELQVLACIWKYSTYAENDEGNCIIINPKILNIIQNETKLNIQSIRNIICNLSKSPKQLLIKDQNFRSTYYLNPLYFFKGSLKDRPKVLKKIFVYTQKSE